jgi:hypothetical protein
MSDLRNPEAAVVAQEDGQADLKVFRILGPKVIYQLGSIRRRQGMGISLGASNGKVVEDRRGIVADEPD